MRTADEISAMQFVSVNTVKTHLRAIYRKLGVRTRRDAVAVARQRGLLLPANHAPTVESPGADEVRASLPGRKCTR